MKSGIIACLFIALNLGWSVQGHSQEFLAGNWGVQGADFAELGLNVSGGANPFLVITKNGTTFDAHLSQDVFVSEINCTVGSALTLLSITPASATNLSVKATYPLPLICINASKTYDIVVSKLAADNNSFTTCRATKPDDCLSWVRIGTSAPPPEGAACSKGLKPSAPTATVNKKSVVAVDVSGTTGVSQYAFELISKKNKSSKTIKISVLTKKPRISRGSLTPGTWGVRVKEVCSKSVSTKVSPYTGFTVK